MSVQLRQSLQATSILSTLMLAPSAAHALMYVLTRQSHCHNGGNANVNANRAIKADQVVSLYLLHRNHVEKLVAQLAVLLEASREV